MSLLSLLKPKEPLASKASIERISSFIDEAMDELDQTSLNQEPPESRREFTRFDLPTEENSLVEVRFGSLESFSKSYARDISIGGLFLKTQLRPEILSIIPISFSVGSDDAETTFHFSLKAQVVRHAPEGIGLKFTNLEGEVRSKLEEYLSQNLKSPVALANPLKKEAVQRLDERRKSIATAKVKARKLKFNLAFIAALIVLNLGLFEISREGPSMVTPNQNEILNFKSGQIEVRQISMISRTSKGFALKKHDGSILNISAQEVDILPPALRLATKGTAFQLKPKRVSKNNPAHRVRLR